MSVASCRQARHNQLQASATQSTPTAPSAAKSTIVPNGYPEERQTTNDERTAVRVSRIVYRGSRSKDHRPSTVSTSPPSPSPPSPPTHPPTRTCPPVVHRRHDRAQVRKLRLLHQVPHRHGRTRKITPRRRILHPARLRRLVQPRLQRRPLLRKLQHGRNLGRRRLRSRFLPLRVVI